jgi:hypothetical protein
MYILFSDIDASLDEITEELHFVHSRIQLFLFCDE